MTLRLEFFAMIARGSDGLDLGAGDGRWTTLATLKRARITAIDLQSATGVLPIGSRWIQADLCEGLPAILEDSSKFDFMMSFDLIQWLPRDFVLEEFLPSLANYAQQGCVLALRTFWRDPVPAFARPVSSLYEASELVDALEGWNIIRSEQIEGDGPSLDESIRHWYSTDILARFP